LLYSWSNTGQKSIIEEFKRMGHSVDKIYIEYKDLNHDEEFSAQLKKTLKAKKYDFVFSYNYFPIISNVCEDMFIKYVGWVWDSPLLTLYSDTIKNTCNYIFIFDKALYEDLKSRGVSRIYYMPLGADVGTLDHILIREQDRLDYSSDISFVGNLYTERNLYDQIKFLPDYIKGYLEGIMKVQAKIYGYNFLEELLNDEIMAEIKKYVRYDLGKDYFAKDSTIFANLFLGQKIAAIERTHTLELISRNFKIDLYTDSDTAHLPGVNNKGYIDYDKVMPKIFKLSKVNLNMTLRNIKTGIPLRIFDIMGAGGFLLTNYQQELFDYFEPDKDFVYYEDEDDLLNKIDYYLKHDNERKEIAFRGYSKIKENHTIGLRLAEILSKIS
jgi:spore maturation protein CgeB